MQIVLCILQIEKDDTRLCSCFVQHSTTRPNGVYYMTHTCLKPCLFNLQITSLNYFPFIFS